MCWSYDTRTYSDCRHCIVLSVLPHIKYFKVVYSGKTETKANLSRKHYWHRCKHRCKRRFMHDIDALPLKFNHTTVYAHIVISFDMPNYVCVQSLTIQQ